MKRLMLAMMFGLWAGVAQAESLLSVTDAWVRWVPPVSGNSAAYFKLHNKGSKPVDLVAVESSVAKTVELHTVEKSGELMEMKQLEKITVPAGGSVVFQPGSHHVMLIGLKEPLQEKQTVAMTLRFSEGESLPVSLPVKQDGAEQNDHHHHHHH